MKLSFGDKVTINDEDSVFHKKEGYIVYGWLKMPADSEDTGEAYSVLFKIDSIQYEATDNFHNSKLLKVT